MSQVTYNSGGQGPLPPIIIQGYTPVTFSGLTNSYTVLPTDYFISVDPQIPGTIILPTNPANGTSFIIKDRTGGATVNNITVSGNGSTVDLLPSRPIAGNFGAMQLRYQANNYEIF